MQSSIGDVDRNISLMQQDVSKQLEETIRVNRQLESSVEATKNIMAVLKGVLQFAECERSDCIRVREEGCADLSSGRSDQIVSQVQGLIDQQRPPAMVQWGNSRETLLSLMAVDVESVARDQNFILRQSQTIEESEQRQASWVSQAPRFLSWLCSNRSDIILVDGNSERYGMARYSSMSLVSSALVQELGRSERSRAISFFCGLHNSTSDDLAGPCGLMRSLVSQLLGMQEVGCDVQLSGESLDALSRYGVRDLCDLFHQILTKNFFRQSPLLRCRRNLPFRG